MLTPISNPPGSTAPGSASGTRSPTAKLTAPQITLRSASGPPVVTRQYLIGFLNPVSSSICKHPGDHDVGDVVPDRLDALDLQADRGQPPRDLADVGRLVQRDVFEQPGQRD